MLKANELRIGNFVQSYADIITVEYVDKLLLKGVFHRDVVYNTSIQVKHCKAIPLTEEWLFNFGFTKNDNKYWFHPMVTYGIYGSNGFYMSNVTPEIQYVHQLQNLYFSLTGVELELSSNVA